MPSLQVPDGHAGLLGVNRPVVPRVDWGAAQVNRDHAHYPHLGIQCLGEITVVVRAVSAAGVPSYATRILFIVEPPLGLAARRRGRECKRYRACPMLIAPSHLG